MLTQNTVSRHVADLEASTLPQFFRNMVYKTGSGRQEYYILKTHLEHPIMNIYMCI